METENTSAELLQLVDEFDQLERERKDLGPEFVRRNVALSLFAGSFIASLVPVVLEYTPLEYGLPWFVMAVAGIVGAKSVAALARGLKRRRELDREMAKHPGQGSVGAPRQSTRGELPNEDLLQSRDT